MSATLEPHWLDTVDFRGKFPAALLELTDADNNPELPLHKKMTADKTLGLIGVTAVGGWLIGMRSWRLRQDGIRERSRRRLKPDRERE